MHAYSFIDVVSNLEWSYDSNLILIGIQKRSLVFVKSLHDQDWQCKIDEGMAGLSYVQWGPSLNHIITVSEFKVRLTVWSLEDKTMQYIKSPKFDDIRGITFSPNKKLMALAEKSANEGGRDQIGIYDVTKNHWECLHHFSPDTFDLETVEFAGDGQHLIITDSNLKCKLIIYQIQFNQGSVSGVQQTVKFQPYENTALGIRNMQVSFNKQYIATGFFDQKLRVYNSLSWKEIFSFDHRLTDLTEDNTPADLNIYAETESREGAIYEVLSRPFKLPILQNHQINSKNDALPRVGISLIAISRDNKFLATKNEICPNVVWIWDLNRVCLNTVMIQKQEVEHIEFCPKTPTLNVSTGNGRLYLWTIRVASVCQVPVNKENFSVHHTSWNPNGKSFAALDKNGLVFVYPQIQFYDENEMAY
ncbi:wd repeat-containing protein wrap73 [Stylonychia lemnae]|uniref:Wd repeat-containing protein wrap73 n=1 Tax=Stylonychia lemnae TaxID=5949 RepID=A0A078AQY5_STYLE|nr:wd repeat-containing protein wrap73 [Stylonychia lemnae]|eukprot:CDW84361.1 wd repeat-containing protein wrap73 [Stylonychia lemnae]